MKVLVTKISDYNYKSSIELNTMEDLLAFIRANDSVIIREPNAIMYGKEYNLQITIYDNHME